ncbi:glycosyltransferase [Candidatus Woesearchaeota archaeon]|nr:glycosyltransferase [Candidatus Woesearchaeota archaeon]
MKFLKFSVIIPVKELNDFLKESIPIMLDIDHKSFEIIILPNEKPKKIPAYIKDKKIRIIPTGKVSPAIKRDIGAEKSRGKYLAFIDDDAYPRKDWLKKAEELFNSGKADAVGGPAVTPKDDSISQKASGLFFETIIGGGGMSYRYKPAKKEFYVDDYPSVNLIVSRKAFFDAGGFDNNFWPGEDTKFCLDIRKKGYKILYSPELVVWHHRRKLFLPHLKQVANYGKHRGYFAKRFPKTSFRPVYFAPSLFLVGNFSLLALGILDIFFIKLWGLLLISYFLILSADVFSRARRMDIGVLAVAAIFFTHIVYGAAFIQGGLSRRFRSVLR